jgi:hypothetical protein
MTARPESFRRQGRGDSPGEEMADEPQTKESPVRRAVRDEVIVPLAMSAAAAAAAYAAKKAPRLVEEKVLAPIKGRGGGRALLDDVIERAPEVLRRTFSRAVDTAREVGGTVEETGTRTLRRVASGTPGRIGSALSRSERERARRDRADRRRQRRDARAR